MNTKRILTICLLAATVILCGSFKKKVDSHLVQFKNDGYFIAVIDGKMFETRDDAKYSADLTNKSADVLLGSSTNNNAPKLTRVANSLTFFGNQFFDESGNISEERINFDYTFNDGALGEASDRKIMLTYNGEKYYSLPEGSTFKITKLMWGADRRYCVMNADFDCKMRRWGIPAEAQPIVRLKGKMENINVSVPSWIVTKNPYQTASGQ